MGYFVEYRIWLDSSILRETFPQQLVPYHLAFRADCICPVSDPGTSSWPGVSLCKETDMWQFITTARRVIEIDLRIKWIPRIDLINFLKKQ